MSPCLLELERGRSKVELQYRRAIRNHLGSVHAIALANIDEFSTGLALISSLPAEARAILKSIHVEYHKKARGRLVAQAIANPLDFLAGVVKRECPVVGRVFDAAGDLVTTVEAVWVVGPASASRSAT